MNWISLLLQLMTLRKGIHESRSMVEAARDYAERGKRTVTSFLFGFLAVLFFFSGLLVAVIDLGLQIDRDAGIHYSGLMISATIFVFFGLLNLLIAWLLANTNASSLAPPPREPENLRAERLKNVLEEFLVRFLSQLGKRSERRDPPSEG